MKRDENGRPHWALPGTPFEDGKEGRRDWQKRTRIRARTKMEMRTELRSVLWSKLGLWLLGDVRGKYLQGTCYVYQEMHT